MRWKRPGCSIATAPTIHPESASPVSSTRRPATSPPSRASCASQRALAPASRNSFVVASPSDPPRAKSSISPGTRPRRRNVPSSAVVVDVEENCPYGPLSTVASSTGSPAASRTTPSTVAPASSSIASELVIPAATSTRPYHGACSPNRASTVVGPVASPSARKRPSASVSSRWGGGLVTRVPSEPSIWCVSPPTRTRAPAAGDPSGAAHDPLDRSADAEHAERELDLLARMSRHVDLRGGREAGRARGDRARLADVEHEERTARVARRDLPALAAIAVGREPDARVRDGMSVEVEHAAVHVDAARDRELDPLLVAGREHRPHAVAAIVQHAPLAGREALEARDAARVARADVRREEDLERFGGRHVDLAARDRRAVDGARDADLEVREAAGRDARARERRALAARRLVERDARGLVRRGRRGDPCELDLARRGRGRGDGAQLDRALGPGPPRERGERDRGRRRGDDLVHEEGSCGEGQRARGRDGGGQRSGNGARAERSMRPEARGRAHFRARRGIRRGAAARARATATYCRGARVARARARGRGSSDCARSTRHVLRARDRFGAETVLEAQQQGRAIGLVEREQLLDEHAQGLRALDRGRR